MKNRTELYEAVTTALNCTFPAVLRCRSSDSYEQLHSYAVYEQWYNAELVMHFRREVHGSEFDGEWTRVRGEAQIGATGRRADWAILAWDTPATPVRHFDAKDVLAVGETKIIGLAAAGCGDKAESQKIATLGQQVNHDALAHCVCFAYLVLPCWSRRRHSLDDSALTSLESYIRRIRDQFRINAGREHVQIITGWFGIEETPQESSADDNRFALLQLLLRRPPGGAWEPVKPPRQHQLSSYIAVGEARTPAQVC